MMIVDPEDPIFSTEPIVDVMGLALQNGEAELWKRRCEFNEIYMKIQDRYNYENQWREHYASNYRSDYTSKQKRRIRKQIWKWRKRLLGEYF